MLVPASWLSSPIATCEVGVLTPIWNVPGLAFSMSMTSCSVFGRHLDVGGQRGRHRGDQRDRHEVLERIVGQVGVEERVHHQRAVDRQQQRVAVGLGLCDRLRADDGVGAGAVVDDDLLAELLAELQSDQPADEIRRPARRERHDQGDGAGWIGLRKRRRRAADDQQRAGEKDAKGRHDSPPVPVFPVRIYDLAVSRPGERRWPMLAADDGRRDRYTVLDRRPPRRHRDAVHRADRADLPDGVVDRRPVRLGGHPSADDLAVLSQGRGCTAGATGDCGAGPCSVCPDCAARHRNPSLRAVEANHAPLSDRLVERALHALRRLRRSGLSVVVHPHAGEPAVSARCRYRRNSSRRSRCSSTIVCWPLRSAIWSCSQRSRSMRRTAAGGRRGLSPMATAGGRLSFCYAPRCRSSGSHGRHRISTIGRCGTHRGSSGRSRASSNVPRSASSPRPSRISIARSIRRSGRRCARRRLFVFEGDVWSCSKLRSLPRKREPSSFSNLLGPRFRGDERAR